MGIQDLQAYLESGDVEGSCVGVDLVRIARSQSMSRANQVVQPPVKPHSKKASVPAAISNGPPFSLVIDAECCLDRLYGGFFSDWVCGGQWNRVTTFLGQFISSLKASNIELAVFFNGCTEPQRTDEWIAEQLRRRAKISQVLRHLVNKGTPPPKVWWTPPSCLKPTLRLVLRNLSVPVFVTMDDHKQEVIAYCRENGCHALVADDGEYIAFNPPRYFSARHLKLTYKGTLESKEYIISELSKSLQLSVDQLCILAALLGNFLLPESELSDLHKKLSLEPPVKSKDGTSVESNPIEAVKAVAAFVRSLQTKELDDLGTEIFGAVGGERAAKFKQAVQYYKDGTKSGFLRFRPYSHKKTRKNKNGEKSEPQTPTNAELNLDTSGFASEANDEGLSSLISTKEVIACLSVSGQESDPATQESVEASNGPAVEKAEEKPSNGTMLSADASSSSSSATSPSRAPSQTDAQPAPPQIKQKKQVRLLVEEDQLDRRVTLPNIASEVMRTVSERHTKGLMSPLIYQILTQGEVKLPVVMEDESFKELSIGIQQFYKPLRQMLYAILFNLNHLTYLARHSKQQNKESGEHHSSKVPDIKVKEWVWTKQNPYERPELTKAEPLGWGVPTVQRLWFGTTVDDKRRRLRTYLTVMRSDTHLMLNPSYVPQHLLVLATVLRYIMSGEKKLLRKHELDAIIAMAFDPNLANCDFNQDLQIQVECVTPRGVQLGALIMTGIEYALVVNDACGAPIPWLMTCPWLFFDGKLLHSTLARASTVKNLLELCEHRIPQVMKVETMREAILEGLYVQWARPNLIQSAVNGRPIGREDVHQVMPAGMNSRGVFRGGPSMRGRGLHRPLATLKWSTARATATMQLGMAMHRLLSRLTETTSICR
ncbi:unnamed protein product, partial [Nesidiocoris tenuis]